MPWRSVEECPRRARLDDPVCEIIVFEPLSEALKGIEPHPQLEVLYWLRRARRDLGASKATPIAQAARNIFPALVSAAESHRLIGRPIGGPGTTGACSGKTRQFARTLCMPSREV